MKYITPARQFITSALITTTLFSCSNNEVKAPTDSPSANGTAASTQEQASTAQGRGTITLTCNGKTIVTEGNCNYSPHATCIVVADDGNAANAFMVNLNGALPEQTTVYNLISGGNVGDGQACMSFTRFPSTAKMINWESDSKSGQLTITVEGNKISGTFNNVPLQPSQFYNPDSLSATGVCSGSFTLYR